ncbi:MAG: DUF4190 domain-containing protein [Verrucomicrobiota bacterium]
MSNTPSTPQVPAIHWSRAAIACFIFAIAGFFSVWLVIGLFLAAIAAVCGHVARHDTASGNKKGRRLATTGLVFSYLAIFSFPILVLIAGLSVPALDKWKEEQGASLREESMAKSGSLFAACEDFARANQNRYPASWNELSGRYIPGHELRKLLRSPYPDGLSEAFEIVPHDRPVLPAISDSVIVIQEIAPPSESRIAVVYADGTVKSIHNPSHE